MLKRETLSSIFPISILGIVVFFLFFKFFLFGYLPIPSDIISLWLPWGYYSKDIPIVNPLLSDPITIFYPYKAHLLKYPSKWNPYIFCGTPFTLISIPYLPFYPLNLLAIFFPPYLVYSLTLIIQIFLAGLFMYLYLRFGSFRLNRFGALLGSIVFMLNGVFAVWLEFETTVGSGLWYPLIFLFIDKTIEHKSINYSILTAISIAMHILSLHLQFTLYLLIASFIYSIFRLASSRIGGIKGLINKGFLIVISLILGLLLSSVYLLPSFEEANLSFRYKKDFGFKELNPLPLANLITFLIPDFYGTPAFPHTYKAIRGWFYDTGLIKERPIKVGGENFNEYCGYIGILPLILAILAGLLRRDKDTRFFFGFLIISLLLALGTFLYLPFYSFAPGFNKMGISRIIFLFCFAGSILAGVGADSITSREIVKKRGISIIIILVLIILALGFSIFLLLPKGNSLIAIHFSFRNPSMSIPIILVISSIIILILSLKMDKGIILLKAFILSIVGLDLLYFGMRYNPMTKKEWLFKETPSLNLLKDKINREPPFRIVALDRILPPNTNILYRLQSVEGYQSFHLSRYHDFMEELVSPDIYHNWIDIFSYADRRFLQLLNVRYILTRYPLNDKDLRLIYDGEIKIYEDLDALARAWVVFKARLIKTKEGIFKELRDPHFDPRECVILEEYDHGLESKGKGVALIKIVDYQPEKVVIRADLEEAGFLVLSDSWYPGWKVFVDGLEGRILKANYIMRAVRLPSGHHQVEFIYDPLSIKIGLIITLSTLILTLILFGYNLFKIRRVF